MTKIPVRAAVGALLNPFSSIEGRFLFASISQSLSLLSYEGVDRCDV